MFRMGMGAKIGAGLVCAAAFALLLAGPSFAKSKCSDEPPGKDMSERRLKMVMKFAWDQVPEQYTSRSKKIVVDTKKPGDAMVPHAIAHQVIRAGWRSGHAQLCGLVEEQKANFATMMARQIKEHKLTDQQQLFIQRLHQTTIMLIVGEAEFVEQEGKQIIARTKAKTNIKGPCVEARRKLIKCQIDEFIEGSKKTAQPTKPTKR
jgi:hypothetical protein